MVERREVKFPHPVRRLRVQVHDGDFHVVDDVRVESMTLPRSKRMPAVESGGRVGGFWYELRDDDGDVLYRRVIPNPLRGPEIFDEHGMHRVPSPPGHVEFEILVPDVEEGAEVRIVEDEVVLARLSRRRDHDEGGEDRG